MESKVQEFSYKKITLFWLPLAATWVMMAVEQPFLTAVVARLANPKINLAAFGIAISFALIAEAPVIMLMSTTTALADNRNSYLKLRNFSIILNGLITISMLLVLVPEVFYYLTGQLMGLDLPLIKITHLTLLLLIPWPAAIGFRRFYQGILIRSKLTNKVAHGTVVRLITMVMTALILSKTTMPGGYVAAVALSLGVIAEAIACRWMVGKTLKILLNSESKAKIIRYRFLIKFYFPLALTSILSLGIHPIVTFFMVKGRMPLESLAVLPVINSLIFLFRSVGLSIQEVIITFLGAGIPYKRLKRFAVYIGITLVFGLAAISFTPLGSVWYKSVAGLTPGLAAYSILPTQILTLLPGLTVLLSFQRGLFVHSKKTAPITIATLIEIIIIILILILTIYFLDLVGAVAAACAFVLGRIFANGYLFYPQARTVSRLINSN